MTRCPSRQVRKSIRKLFQALQMESKRKIIPRCLQISEEECTSENERWKFGGFADVHKGTYRNQLIVVKTIRRSKDTSDSLADEAYRVCYDAWLKQKMTHPPFSDSYMRSCFGKVSTTNDFCPCTVLSLLPNSVWCRHYAHIMTQSVSLRKWSNTRRDTGGRASIKCLCIAGCVSSPRLYVMFLIPTQLLQIAEGLEHLHREGIVHGDLHPVSSVYSPQRCPLSSRMLFVIESKTSLSSAPIPT